MRLVSPLPRADDTPWPGPGHESNGAKIMPEAHRLHQQVSHLRSASFQLVDELVSRNRDAAGPVPTIALTHMQDVANKLGVIESLLTRQVSTG